ncbi:UNVERIFIED_CONTAM: hypothetical protein FKN15_016563 [Acipenser sinensis]
MHRPHCSRSPSLQVRLVKGSKQTRDIMDMKAQIAQVLELLSKKTPVALAAVPAPMLPQVPYPPFPRGDQGEREEASQLAHEYTRSISASWVGTSFSSGIEAGGEPEPPAEAEPGFEVASEASVPPLSSSTLALMERPWTPVAEPRRSVFRTQATASRPQILPAFPDFMEEVRTSWDRPASAPSVLKQAAQLASLEGVEKLGLAGFPPVDSTIAALVKAPGVLEPAMQSDGDTPQEGILSGGTGNPSGEYADGLHGRCTA